MFISLVECFMLSALSVRMPYLFAYHGHDNLSHWQFCHLFCLSMSLCTIYDIVGSFVWVCTIFSLYLYIEIFFESCWHLSCVVLLFGSLLWACFSCRCLVDLPGVKTLLLTNQQHQLLKGLDYHLRHLKTPMKIGSDFCLTHMPTQTFLTSQQL